MSVDCMSHYGGGTLQACGRCSMEAKVLHCGDAAEVDWNSRRWVGSPALV